MEKKGKGEERKMAISAVVTDRDINFSDVTLNHNLSPFSVTIDASKKSLAEKNLDQQLIEAIDEAITSLGAPVKNTLYQQLTAFNIEKKDIPQKMDDFLYLIHKIFGLGGSRLELKFALNLQAKVKLNTAYSEADLTLPNWIAKEMSFKACLNEVRKSLDLSVRE
jgi:hypothetical protein